MIETVISNYIYQQLCMSKLHPVRYMMQAALIYVAMRTSINFGLEFPTRKYYINQ